ncbi:MAG: hypothetical protein AAF628_01225 [Planctomycetota bacterium]
MTATNQDTQATLKAGFMGCAALYGVSAGVLGALWLLGRLTTGQGDLSTLGPLLGVAGLTIACCLGAAAGCRPARRGPDRGRTLNPTPERGRSVEEAHPPNDPT